MMTMKMGAKPSRLLKLLWLIDLGFIGLHAGLGAMVVTGHLTGIPDDFSLGHDRAFPESFNYLKWLAIIGIMIRAAPKALRYWPAVAALSFGMILLDDFGQLHESLGRHLQGLASDKFLASPWGEVMAFGILGLAELSLLVLAWALGQEQAGKSLRQILPLLLVLAGFGVVIDALHGIWNPNKITDGLWVVLEDGGEMLVASALLDRVYQLGKALTGGLQS